MDSGPGRVHGRDGRPLTVSARSGRPERFTVKCGETGVVRLTRRQFIAVTAGAAAGAAIPEAILKWTNDAALATAGQAGFFLDATRMATCAAACARLVPTGTDAASDPGAAEAHAAVFIDRFLAAFELPSTVADNPAIWGQGPYSGRNAYPDPTTGEPSATLPPDDMLDASGQMQCLPLSRTQTIVWKAILYGTSALSGELANPQTAKWAKQVVAGTIPGISAGGLRKMYADGLDAMNSYSGEITGQPFAGASSLEQDAMLALMGNIVLDAIGPSLPSLPLLPPPAAEALFPTLLSHTFAACYGLPEYRGLHSNPLWAMIGWDGDTQPLGNSVYDEDLPGAGPGEGPNAGFGEEGVYVPAGGYKEYRPVSYLGPDDTLMTLADAKRVLGLISKKGGTA